MKHIEDFGAKHLQQYSKLFRIFFLRTLQKKGEYSRLERREMRYFDNFELSVCRYFVTG